MPDHIGNALGFSQSPRLTGHLRRERRFRAGGARETRPPEFLTDRVRRLVTGYPQAPATKLRALTGLRPLIVAG
jgi:hypothetical protein